MRFGQQSAKCFANGKMKLNANFIFYLIFLKQGQIRNNPRSKIAVSTCDGIKGFVYDVNETYSIEPNENGTLQDSHYLFR